MTSDYEYRKQGGILVASGGFLAVLLVTFSRMFVLVRAAADTTVFLLVFFFLLFSAAGAFCLGQRVMTKHSVDGRPWWLFTECALIGLAIGCLALSAVRAWPVTIALTVVFFLSAAIIATVRWRLAKRWRQEREYQRIDEVEILGGFGEESPNDDDEFSEADEDLLDGNGDDSAEGPSDMQ